MILAGGRGTRFWPLSRKRMAKQLLPLNSDKSMIQETVERLLPLAKAKQFWIITNADLRDPIVRQLKGWRRNRSSPSPLGETPRPRSAWRRFCWRDRDPTAVIGMFPSDHVIENEKRFREDIKRAASLAASGANIVVIGIPPTRAETGYGYIEAGGKSRRVCFRSVASLRSLPPTSPNSSCGLAISSGTVGCSSGERARWLTRCSEHLPKTAPLLEKIAASYGTRSFEKTFARLYPKCENISIDYAVLEPRSAKGEGKSGIYCIPASFGWNDLGSWTALYEHRSSGKDGENVIHADAELHAECRRELHPLQTKVCCGGGSEESGGGGDRRRAADHHARAFAGRRQGREASG